MLLNAIRNRYRLYCVRIPRKADHEVASAPYERIQRLFEEARNKRDQKHHEKLAEELAVMEHHAKIAKIGRICISPEYPKI